MDCQNSSQAINDGRVRAAEFRDRVGLALNALDAVRELCREAATKLGNTLGHVDADNFACLLGLIVDEMRDAHDAA